MLHIPGYPKFYSSRNLTSGKNNGERNGQLEGYSSRQCACEDLQRCANFKVAARRMWAQQKLKLIDEAWQWSNYYLLFPCSISVAESFVTCLRNKAYVYLKKAGYFVYPLCGIFRHGAVQSPVKVSGKLFFVCTTRLFNQQQAANSA